MRTLISPSEVITNAPVDSNFSSGNVSPHISRTEFRHLQDDKQGCLGSEFYQALLDNMRTFDQWDSTTNWDAGDVVIYESQLFEAVINVTGTIPGTDLSKWSPVSKFANNDFQELWDEYLGQLLAFMVIHASVFKTAFKMTNQGVMRNRTDGSDPASTDGVKLLKDELMSDVEIMFNRMDKYLRDNKTKFPLYKGNQNCGTGCTHGRMVSGVYVDTSPDTSGLDYFGTGKSQ